MSIGHIKEGLKRLLFDRLLKGTGRKWEERPVVKGYAHLVLKGPDGKIKTERFIKNLIVDDGEEMLADLIGGTGTDYVKYIAVGTNSTAPAETDVELNTELGSRQTVYANRTGSYTEILATFAAGVSTGALRESGCFDHATATTDSLLCRQTFAVINKGASDSLEVTWKITFD
jgi:hypothetical protein